MADERDEEASIILDGIDFVRDEGTVLVFEGRTEEGQVVTFACDARLGHALREGLAIEEEPLRVQVEPWQILSTVDG